MRNGGNGADGAISTFTPIFWGGRKMCPFLSSFATTSTRVSRTRVAFTAAKRFTRQQIEPPLKRQDVLLRRQHAALPEFKASEDGGFRDDGASRSGPVESCHSVCRKSLMKRR